MQTDTSTAAKPARRTAARPAARPHARTRKLTTTISHEAYMRLYVHAGMTGRDMGDILDSLIRDGLKEWKVAAWGVKSDQATPTVSVDSAAAL